jgi:hypothetical protein
MSSQVEKVTFVQKGGKVIAGVCHGCGNRFVAVPGTNDQDTIRQEILKEVGNHRCVPGQGRDPELLQKMKWLLIKEGRLSERLVKQTAGMPSLLTLHQHLGSFRRIYRLVGYNPRMDVFAGSNHRQHTYELRTQLVNRLKDLFGGTISVHYSRGSTRPQLHLGENVKMSISICRAQRTRIGELQWLFHPVPAREHHDLLLLALLDQTNSKFVAYYVLQNPKTTSKHIFKKDDSLLAASIPLDNLAHLCGAATRLLARSEF